MHTINQLYDAMQRDLLACQTTQERIMVNAIGGKEIRETAEAIARKRKLTKTETDIATRFGFKL